MREEKTLSSGKIKVPNKIFASILLLLFFVPQVSLAQSNQNTVPVGSQEIVVYTGKSRGNFKALNKNITTLESKNDNLGVYTVPATELPELQVAKARGEIEAFSYNTKYKVSLTPADPGYPDQDALPQISAPQAWDVSTGSPSVTVAVIDTGFQLNHEDLASRFVQGQDFLPGTLDEADASLSDFVEVCENPSGAYYHGTMVAGVIAANENSTGVAGLDWQAKIMPLQAMDNCGVGNLDDIATAINYAVTNGADVINMSLGGSSGNDVLAAAVENAHSSGVTMVAASGNDNGAVSYPAAYADVIAVGSVNGSDVRSSFSNYGAELDVVAPGEAVLTTNTAWNGASYSTNAYAYANGTSLAAPFVAGVASLLLGVSQYTPDEIRGYLYSGSTKVSGMSGQNFTNYYGYGRANAYESIKLTETPVVPQVSKLQITSQTKFNSSTRIVGNSLSANFILKNNNTVPIALDRVKLHIRGGTLNLDLMGGSNVTIAAGSSLAFNSLPNSSILVKGYGNYSSSIQIMHNGIWSGFASDNHSRLTGLKFDPAYIKITKALSYSPNPVGSSGIVTANYRLYNTKGSFTLDRIKVTMSSGQHFTGYSNQAIIWNGSYNFSNTRTIETPGTYYGKIAYMVAGKWYNVGSTITLKVVK